MTAARPTPGRRSRTLLVGLVVLCVLVVAGLLLGQRAGDTGDSGASGPGPTATQTQPQTQTPSQTRPPSQVPSEEPEPTHTPMSGLPRIAESDLPAEAWDTMQLIYDGGPYPYRQDDSTFFNREGILPDQRRGYYREYTVETPRSRDRGARRIVAGADGDLYYTDDHYDSFRQIAERE